MWLPSTVCQEVQWELPPLSSRGGIIRGYKIFVRPTNEEEEMILNISTNATDVYVVEGLERATS